MPILALFTLVSYIYKVDKFYFKREIGVKSSIGRLELGIGLKSQRLKWVK